MKKNVPAGEKKGATFFSRGDKRKAVPCRLLRKNLADSEWRGKVEIWLRIDLIMDMPKNWERNWTTVGALFFTFLPKTSFWKYLLGTLGDALIKYPDG